MSDHISQGFHLSRVWMALLNFTSLTFYHLQINSHPNIAVLAPYKFKKCATSHLQSLWGAPTKTDSCLARGKGHISLTSYQKIQVFTSRNSRRASCLFDQKASSCLIRYFSPRLHFKQSCHDIVGTLQCLQRPSRKALPLMSSPDPSDFVIPEFPIQSMSQPLSQSPRFLFDRLFLPSTR